MCHAMSVNVDEVKRRFISMKVRLAPGEDVRQWKAQSPAEGAMAG